MRHSIITLLLIVLFSSCITNDKPRIVPSNENRSDALPDLVKNSSKINVADLPIHIDSTSYLLHPIGEFSIEEERGKIIYKSSRSGGNNFSISSSNRNSISGDLSNIMFQHILSEELKPLTTKTIRIQSVTFLREIYNKTKQEFLLYVINDQDTNQDKKLDSDDIKTLYLSTIDGRNFKKITTSNRELIDWKIISTANRLYFKTIEDTNKDGDFDERDKIFYNYVNLSSTTLKVVEYNPL